MPKTGVGVPFEGLAMPQSAVCYSLGLQLSNRDNKCEGTGLHIRSGLLMQQNGAVTPQSQPSEGSSCLQASAVRLVVQLRDDSPSICDWD